MGATGVKLQGPARRKKAEEAYELALRQVSYTEIGRHLNVSRNLVSKLVLEEQERIWESRDLSELTAEKRRSIATYEAVIRGAWKRLSRVQDASLNVSGLYNVIISAQKSIDEITGAKAPARSEADVNVTYKDTTLDEYFAALDAHRAGDGQADLRKPVDTR